MESEVVKEREYANHGGLSAERQIERVRDGSAEPQVRGKPNDWIYETAGIVLLLVASGWGLWALSVRASEHMPVEFFVVLVGILTVGLWVLQTDLDAPVPRLVRTFFLALFTVGCVSGLIALGLWFPQGWGWLMAAACAFFLWGLLRQYRGG